MHHPGALVGEKHERQENRHRRQCRQCDSQPDITQALDRGVNSIIPLLSFTEDVFNDNNRVVDKHADTQRQSHEREDVESAIGEVNPRDGDKKREGNRKSHQKRQAELTEKDQ